MDLLTLFFLAYLIAGILVTRSLATTLIRSVQQGINDGRHPNPFYEDSLGLLIHKDKVEIEHTLQFTAFVLLGIIAGPAILLWVIITSH